MVGKQLGTTVEYVWWLSFNQRRALRNTMEGCDAYFALPADAAYRVKGVEKSNAFLSVSYAIVAPAGQTFTGLADLKGKRVGVMYGSPPKFCWPRVKAIHGTLSAPMSKCLKPLKKVKSI